MFVKLPWHEFHEIVVGQKCFVSSSCFAYCMCPHMSLIIIAFVIIIFGQNGEILDASKLIVIESGHVKLFANLSRCTQAALKIITFGYFGLSAISSKLNPVYAKFGIALPYFSKQNGAITKEQEAASGLTQG